MWPRYVTEKLEGDQPTHVKTCCFRDNLLLFLQLLYLYLLKKETVVPYNIYFYINNCIHTILILISIDTAVYWTCTTSHAWVVSRDQLKYFLTSHRQGISIKILIIYLRTFSWSYLPEKVKDVEQLIL